jgi:hypothetical protein
MGLPILLSQCERSFQRDPDSTTLIALPGAWVLARETVRANKAVSLVRLV